MSTQAREARDTRAGWRARLRPRRSDLVAARRRRRHRGAGRRLGDFGLRRRAPRLAPSSRPDAVNIHDAATLTGGIRAALDNFAGRGASRSAPDTVAKVSLIRFEKVPAKVQDLDQLIRWQVRKAAPFRIEDAQVSWVPGVAIDGGGREFVVTVARKDLIAGYEKACEAAGAHAGVVDLASFNLMNTVLAVTPSTPGDWLLVHIGADYATLAVVRGPDLVFFRNRGAAGPAEFADLVHQMSMYHEDRLGAQVPASCSRAPRSGTGPGRLDPAEHRNLEDRIGFRTRYSGSHRRGSRAAGCAGAGAGFCCREDSCDDRPKFPFGFLEETDSGLTNLFHTSVHRADHPSAHCPGGRDPPGDHGVQCRRS